MNFEAKLLHEKNGKLDLTQLFDKLMKTFRTRDVTHTEEDNLQSAMVAQMQHQAATSLQRNMHRTTTIRKNHLLQ